MPNTLNQYQLSLEKEKEFWSKINKKKDHECWPWTGYLDRDGYGRLHIDDSPKGIHRIAWELTRKCKVPEGKMILHMCDNRSCGNPHHLYCGTQLDNMRDRNERNPVPSHKLSNPKLYAGEIWLIRKLLGHAPQWKIAKMFKVDQSTISHINTSKEWPSKGGTYV